jgi:dihydroorotate dehydrogenase (fumarate)
MASLETKYLGLKLSSPLVVSSTPLSESVTNLRRMEDSGAGAVILTSLFEEQLILESKALDADLSRGTESFAESLGYLPDYHGYRQVHETYLEQIREAKAAVKIPICASLNGATPGGWTHFAREIQQAGADALELNTYALASNIKTDPATIERRLVELVGDVRRSVTIPVSVKLSPFYTSIPWLAGRLVEAGANGLVLFNRFYQPDFDIEALEVVPHLHFSRPDELTTRLHWVAILYGQLKADLAITGGVHSASDAIKAIMAGANVAMVASALHIQGIEHLRTITDDLAKWLEEHEYESLDQMRGSLSRKSAPDPSQFDRGNYIKTLSAYSLRDFQPAD